MTRRARVALGLAGLAALTAGGLVVSRTLGSRPAHAGMDGPIPACPRSPNCERVRVPLDAAPDDVRAAALGALRQSGGLTGRAVRLAPTPDGARVVFAVGPFRDDVVLAVEAAPGGGSVLWLRSASRTGRSDLGVNRWRVARIVEATRAALAADGGA